MSNLTQLRIAAREIFDEALSAVDAGKAVQRAVQLSGLTLTICNLELDLTDRPIYSIAIGKASTAMAAALEGQIGERISSGLIVGPTGQQQRARNPGTIHQLSPLWHVCEGGHPLPAESSLLAAKEAFALLERANEERALLIFLISGGGSAMIEYPITDDISLGELRAASTVLINCGASIGEINSVRRAFSAVKGGRLSARSPDCDQITLIVSDVPEGEERNVASGPTLPSPPDAPKALDVLFKYNLQSKLPASIMRSIEMEISKPPSQPFPSHVAKHFVLLNNLTALEAAAEAARKRGFVAEIATDISDPPIQEGCKKLRERLEALRATHRNDTGVVCLVSGGEFACPVNGDGLGGRNLETALRLARLTNSDMPDAAALCAGTDGIDGNSPAAGALLDSTTMVRARSIGLEPDDFLGRSDSYSFFVALGDVINTGATGTNVRDLRILLARTHD